MTKKEFGNIKECWSDIFWNLLKVGGGVPYDGMARFEHF